MTLILRKCWNDGLSSHNFYYGNKGDIVTAPDWNPEPKCGNGLHGLKNGNGAWYLLQGDDYLIIEADDKDIVDIDQDKCKFRTGKIVFRGTTKQLSESEFPSKLNLYSPSAFNWAYYVGNHDVMINKINDSEHAYLWAMTFGNKDIMINKITDSYYAYCWAKTIGNYDIMISKIVDSRAAYYWALNIGGNIDIMMNKITESYWAYQWARDIGNEDIMKPKVTEKLNIYQWNETFPNNKIET